MITSVIVLTRFKKLRIYITIPCKEKKIVKEFVLIFA